MRKYSGVFFCLCMMTAWAFADDTRRIQLVEQNVPAVVAVNVLRTDGKVFTATGFIVTPDGVIATNHHVIKNALYVNITFSDGTVSTKAQPIIASQNVDLALLQIPAKKLPTVRLVSSQEVRPGQDITIIGNPRRLQNSVFTGIISQVRRRSDDIILHQITTPLSPSSSGSPVFDEKGRVISIAFGTYAGEDNQNLNFAIPSDYLMYLLQVAGQTIPPVPVYASDENSFSSHPFIRHVQKSWAILKRILTTNRSKVPPAS